MEWWGVEIRLKTTFLEQNHLEVEQQQENMELKLPRSRTVTTKQTASREMTPPWSVCGGHCFNILLLFLHSTSIVTCGCLWATFYTHLGVKFGLKWSINLQTQKRTILEYKKRKKSAWYSIKLIILPKNSTKWPQNRVHFMDLSEVHNFPLYLAVYW